MCLAVDLAILVLLGAEGRERDEPRPDARD